MPTRKPIEKGDDSRKNWRRINEHAGDLDSVWRDLRLLKSEVDRLRGLLRTGATTMHPFRIYNVPSRLGGGYAADIWRKFRVRSGSVIFESATAVNAGGTDGETDPDSSGASISSTNIFTVPDETSAYWVWLEMLWGGTSWTVTVKHGAAPDENGWTDWPALDGRHIPIGKIDTQTKTATKQALVRQYLRGDIIFGPVEGVCVDDVVRNFVFAAAYREAS